MKYLKADLLANVVGSYDQTKTTITGNVHSKVINATNYLGPALNKWMDVITDSGITPAGIFASPNGRVFVITTTESPSSYHQIALYNFNYMTGVNSYVGKISCQLPEQLGGTNTTQTLRGFKVIDTGTTGWKIFITTTANQTQLGGIVLVNKVDLADFTAIPTTFSYAIADDAKATYALRETSLFGASHLLISANGTTPDWTNNKIYVRNGTTAVYQYYVFNTNTAPTMLAPASVSVSVASPGVVTYNAHPFNDNDTVMFTAGTVPTGLVVGNVYYVRNKAANTFQLSASSGGASINTTGSPSAGAFLTRAFGATDALFAHKTGNLPAISGTLISNDSDDYAIPNHGVNSGFPCAFFSTSTTLYLGRLADLTPGAVTWPNLASANMAGDATTILQTARAASWSNSLDRAIVNTTGSFRLIMKQAINNSIDRIFGRTNITSLEGTTPQVVYLGANTETTVVGLDLESGWLFMAINQSGQRGIICMDLRSDAFFDYSNIYTKVLTVDNSVLKFLARWRALDLQTDGLQLSYRTSGFGVATGGWTVVNAFADISSITLPTSQIQFKVQFDSLSKESKALHAQINELFLGYESNTGISDNWEFSDDFSDNVTPSRSAFRLKVAYASVVPQLFFRAYDLTNALLINNNIVTNAANFEYSTDNGMTWLPLGTIPNTVGTLIRYTFTSPPGVDIRPGLKES